MTVGTPNQTDRRTEIRHSILYPHPYDADLMGFLPEPTCFSDLLLDQVTDTIAKGREDYQLLPFFYDHLTSKDDVAFRHEVWRDLDIYSVVTGLRLFTSEMHDVRQRNSWAAKTQYIQHRRGIHLDAVTRYCEAVKRLSSTLESSEISSRALLNVRDVVTTYASSPTFENLVRESQDLKTKLSEVRYCLNVRGSHVRVLRYEGEADYGAEIEEAFERFQQGEVSDYRMKFSDWPDMNHVEAQIADRVALLFRDLFSELQSFCERSSSFVDGTVSSFNREIQFYFAYLDYIGPLKARNLSFCLPDVRESKAIFAKETFDIALAAKLATEGTSVISNNFSLDGVERIMVISGPNQGGKTTFSRTFGQLHFLASLGCPVPGESASLFLFDELFTHFGKEEDPTFQSGKLEDDLLRIQDVLKRATSKSVIIMNEIFASTTTQDALMLGTKVLEKVIELDALCVVVTFIDELSLLGPSIVSMTSSVNPDNPVERTFKIIRHPADGLAYAISIAEKYDLTYDRLRKRVGP
jgi:DNA mismatch repair protein MutS